MFGCEGRARESPVAIGCLESDRVGGVFGRWVHLPRSVCSASGLVSDELAGGEPGGLSDGARKQNLYRCRKTAVVRWSVFLLLSIDLWWCVVESCDCWYVVHARRSLVEKPCYGQLREPVFMSSSDGAFGPSVFASTSGWGAKRFQSRAGWNF